MKKLALLVAFVFAVRMFIPINPVIKQDNYQIKIGKKVNPYWQVANVSRDNRQYQIKEEDTPVPEAPVPEAAPEPDVDALLFEQAKIHLMMNNPIDALIVLSQIDGKYADSHAFLTTVGRAWGAMAQTYSSHPVYGTTPTAEQVKEYRKQGKMKKQCYARAILAFEKANALKPNDVQSIVFVAASHWYRYFEFNEQADADKAAELYKKVIKLDPEYTDFVVILGMIYHVQGDRATDVKKQQDLYTEAHGYYDESLGNMKENPTRHFAKEWVLEQLKIIENMVPDLRTW